MKIAIYNDSCVVYFNSRIVKLRLSDITYIESCGHAITINLSGGRREKVSSTMKYFEERLGDLGFLRIHTGYIINIESVSEYSANFVKMLDGKLLPVSRHRIQKLKKQLNQITT